MSVKLTVLENIRVASPCTANWEQMTGDQKTRFCHQCKLNVHNFSAMTEQEVLRLLTETEGRVCGRFYLRRDGTILTRDCPVGIAALRRRLARIFGSAAAAVLFAAGLVASCRPNWIAPARATPPRVLMGGISWTPPAPAPPEAGNDAD